MKSKRQSTVPKTIYSSSLGKMYWCHAETFLGSEAAQQYEGKVQLLLTSPPFPLNRKKKYGNLCGDAYSVWLAGFAQRFRKMLMPAGSIVLELGNAWEPRRPIMSTLGLESLLAFKATGGLRLIQQFIVYNPARLPSPAQWVNVERIRVKDSFTHAWWLARSDRPYADNNSVLVPYSESMKELLRSGKYSSGKRPSEHRIGAKSFLRDNGGAIPSNVLSFANTASTDCYQEYCRQHELRPHPARMQAGLAEFFIRFLTREGDLVFDPFSGSNTTGSEAERLNRRWISVEANSDYIRASRGRFVKANK